MEYVKTCPICGKAFITNRSLNKYCSRECSLESRRKRDREHKRAKRSSLSADRKQKAQEREIIRKAELADRSRRQKEAFEALCNAGNPRALMLRSLATSGNVTEEYWQLFANAEIREAEQAGKVSNTMVNGYSVYDDCFAEKVVESIRDIGHISISTIKRKKMHM